MTRIIQHDDIESSSEYGQLVTHAYASGHTISEPTGDQFLRNARKISANNYEALDFSEPDFVRNIFKALRLKVITLEQMLLAKDIYEVLQWQYAAGNPTPAIRQFSLSDSTSPFAPTATKRQIELFQSAIETPFYYTVDFSKPVEILFFLKGMDEGLHKNPNFSLLFVTALKQFILQHNEPILLSYIDQLIIKKGNYDDKGVEYALYYFIARILRTYATEITTQHRESCELLAAIIATGEDNPPIALSPQFQTRDPSSPALCFVAMSLLTRTLLLNVIYGKNACKSWPTAGEFDTRYVRHLIEKHNARPIEITHPDLPANLHPHKRFCFPIILSEHDKYHLQRCSSIPKGMFHHLRKLFSQKGICQKAPFEMSKAIWALTDLDISFGFKWRKFINSDYNHAHDYATLRRAHIFFINCFLDVVKNIDDTLKASTIELIAADIMRNTYEWIIFLNQMSFDFGRMNFRELILGNRFEIASSETENPALHSAFKSFFESPTVIACIENANMLTEEILLRYRLETHPDMKALCAQLTPTKLQEFFYWEKNSGLHINEKYRERLTAFNISESALDNLSPLQLATVLRELTRLCTHSPRLFTPKPPESDAENPHSKIRLRIT